MPTIPTAIANATSTTSPSPSTTTILPRQPAVAPGIIGGVGEALGAVTWWAVTVDSTNPLRLAEFWSRLLRRPVTEAGPDRPGWYRLHPLEDRPPFLNFQPVPGPVR